MAIELMWQMLWDGVWGARGGRDRPQEQWLAEALPTLRSQLATWQDSQERAQPLKTHTRIQFITQPMIGTAAKRCLALKAAESKAFFRFLSDTIQTNTNRVWHGEQWASCAKAMHNLLLRMASMPWKLSPVEYEERPCPNNADAPLSGMLRLVTWLLLLLVVCCWFFIFLLVL